MWHVTLDFDVLIDLIDSEAAGRFKPEMAELAALVPRNLVELTYPRTVNREIERGSDPHRREHYLRALDEHDALSSNAAPPGVFRLNVSRFDDPSAVLGTDDDALLDTAIRAILMPRKGPWADNDVHVERTFADVDHLLAHARARRDVFVTGNARDFTARRCQRLQADLGIVVMDPADLLRAIEASPSGPAAGS